MTFDGADADWQESFRRRLYPRLHGPLTRLGDRLGVPLYSLGRVGENQLVGVLDEDEEVIEEELEAIGFRRNPIAALKRLEDGRVSEGSWVLRHVDEPALIASGMQLHVTLFAVPDNPVSRVVYAHYEDDWRHDATGHLTSKRFSARRGVRKMRYLLNSRTFLTLR